MNTTIHKFVIPVRESFMLPGVHQELLQVKVEMPYGAEILSAENQRETLTVWAMVNPDEKRMAQRKFALLATGATLDRPIAAELQRDFVFMNTVLFSGGSFVLHVFKRV